MRDIIGFGGPLRNEDPDWTLCFGCSELFPYMDLDTDGVSSELRCVKCLKYAERSPEFRIRKLPLLRSAPWTILSPRRLQMVGCLGYVYSEGVWAYPFKTQQYALFALEHALKRESK